MSGFIMKTVLLIGVFQSLFFIMLILQKKNKALHDYILAGWLLYLGFMIGIYAFYSEELFDRIPHWINSYISLLMLHGPFLYFYTLALLSKRSQLTGYKTLLHFLPLIFFNVYLVIAFNIPPIAQNIRLDYVNSGIKLPWLYVVFLSATALSGPVYIMGVMQVLNKHQLTIVNNYSNLENINLSWLWKLVIAFGAVWIGLIVFAFIHHLMFLFTRDFCTNGLFLSLTVFVLLVGYFGLRQSVIIQPYTLSKEEAGQKSGMRYAGSGLRKETGLGLMKKLETYMEKTKPYLDPELTLQQLADQVEIPLHQLSQIINVFSNQNFFDYINSYRIKEVKRKMTDPDFDDYSLLGLALDSGFNSKSAFNRYFKKATGITPRDYRKSHPEPESGQH